MKVSAGLLLCRRHEAALQFLLVHPGGPFFAKRDDGWWSIPKGLVDPGEALLDAAIREFREETGFAVPDAGFEPLGEITQKSGKLVHAWAFLGDCDPAALRSNTVMIRGRPYPEVDRAAFFPEEAARRKILPAQAPFLDRARERLGP